jgi:FkbM family methyltransferase
MIIQISRIVSLFECRGVIHVGAHHGWEYPHYKAAGLTDIVMIEPHPGNFAQLTKGVGPECVLFNTALGRNIGSSEMHVEEANMGQSNSLLKPAKHLDQYPKIQFTGTVVVPVTTLDDLPIERQRYNFLSIDVQGYELEVLKGGVLVLPGIDAICCEVNRDEVYEKCARVEEIDDFLAGFGFKRIITEWVGGIWGDALYLRG